MTIKREAAYHEAGHAVAAYHSDFHSIIGPINLKAYGSGEAYISLSKKKLQGKGKTVDPSSAKDKDVAVDLAVVLAAGLVAEQLAATREQGIVPDATCALPDHELLQQQLAAAGLSRKFDRHEATATRLLEAEWPLVAALADHLYGKISSTPDEVCAVIDNYYGIQQ